MSKQKVRYKIIVRPAPNGRMTVTIESYGGPFIWRSVTKDFSGPLVFNDPPMALDMEEDVIIRNMTQLTSVITPATEKQRNV